MEVCFLAEEMSTIQIWMENQIKDNWKVTD